MKKFLGLKEKDKDKESSRRRQYLHYQQGSSGHQSSTQSSHPHSQLQSQSHSQQQSQSQSQSHAQAQLQKAHASTQHRSAQPQQPQRSASNTSRTSIDNPLRSRSSTSSNLNIQSPNLLNHSHSYVQSTPGHSRTPSFHGSIKSSQSSSKLASSSSLHHQFQPPNKSHATTSDSLSFLSSSSIGKNSPLLADSFLKPSSIPDPITLDDTLDDTFNENDLAADKTLEAIENKANSSPFPPSTTSLGDLQSLSQSLSPKLGTPPSLADNSTYDSSKLQYETEPQPQPQRKESIHSVISSTADLNKKQQHEMKRPSRSVLPKVLSSSRSNYAPSVYSVDQSFISSARSTVFNSGISTSTAFSGSNNQSNLKNAASAQFSISSLVRPEWDSSSKKSSWANRIADPNDPRLFRLELKGSYLLVHKPPPEVSYAKSLNVTVNQHSSDSSMGMILDNEFVKSKTELAPSSQPIVKTESSVEPEDVQFEEQSKNEKENGSPENRYPLIQSDSMLLSEAIDEFESTPGTKEKKLPSGNDYNNHITNREAYGNYNQLLGVQSVEMNQRPQSSSQGNKHLPLIIHDLYYQSPSCPHPKLVFDMTSGLILRGTLEAMCHTILFYPSDRMAEKLVEILPLVSSLSEPLVYFLKYLEHFTDTEALKKKSIIMTDMETGILLSRIKRIIEITLEKFKGTLLDDEIFNLLINLVNLLSKKSANYLKESEIKHLSEQLISQRASLLNLISFERVSSSSNVLAPIEILHVSPHELISGEKFIMQPTESLAHEIHAIDAHFMKYWSPRSDRSTIFSRLETIEASFEYWRFNPLQFIPPIHTHYLGRLLAYHLFEDKTTSTSPEKRSHVLMKWIHLGSTLCEQGDMVSWLGIAIMICSQPVLRLSETWGHVERSYLQTIKKKWAPVVFEVRKNELFGSKYPADKQNHSPASTGDLPVSDPLKNETNSNIRIMITNRVGESYAKEDAIPHFGELFTASTADLKSDSTSTLGSDIFDGESNSVDLFKTDFIKYYCSYLEIVGWNLKQWDNYYDTITNKPGVHSKFSNNLESSQDPSIIDGCKDETLSEVLKTAITFNASEGPFSLNYFMSLSIQAEPPYVGQFARYHGTSRSPLFLGSYASILFPEILPYYGIYDRRELIGAIGGANVIEPNENGKHKNRNLSLKHVRDLFNAGCEEFRLEDGSIIFKTTEIAGDGSTKTSDEESSKRSRPSSVLFENPNHPKHMSTISAGSFSLEDYITSYQTYLKDAINETTLSKPATDDLSKLDVDKSLTDTDTDGGEIKNVTTSPKSASSVDIVTTAASTERLVDLLVLTASVFGTHIRMEDIKRYSKKTTNEGPILLQMDDSAFTCTFFAMYRVFYTTKQLIDSLHKRFDGSKSAALSIAKFMITHSSNGDNASLFPQWNDKITDDHDTWSKINWKFVVQIQLGVIEATLILANDYFRHLMDDVATKATFDTFLEMMDVTIVSEWPKILKWLKENSTPEVLSGVLDVYKSLQSAYKQVRNICIRKSYTPQCGLVELSFTNELTSIPKYLKLPPSTDIDEISVFINKLDETIASVMSPIRSEDWIDTFEIIQMLITRSPLAMFNYNYQDASTHPDLILVSNIYNWIMTLCDSEAFSKAPTDKLINKLPPTIRSVFRLYERIQKYFLMQIVDPECNLDQRIERMSTLLKVIQICHARMKNVKLFDEVDNTSKFETSPYIPSFIESVVVNTIMLPESRFFSHSWKLAAEVWKTGTGEEWSCERLADMLPKLSQYEANTIQPESLSLCPGWILSRLVELACFVPNMDVDNTTLINFNKNRFVYNCVLKIHGLQSRKKKANSPYMSEFSFLFEFQGALPTLKSIYQCSSHERSVEKLEKCAVFSSHVREQIQLIKLEQNKRELLLRQREKQNLNIINKHNSQLTEPFFTENDAASIATSTITKSQSFVGSSSILDNSSTYMEGDGASMADTTTSTAVGTVDPDQSIISVQSVQSTQSSSTLTRASVSRSQKPSLQQQQQQQQAASGGAPSSKFKFGFFKSRPFSLNINNFSQPAAQKRNVELTELPTASNLTAKQKPYLSIMLKDVSIFPTYRTPNSFTIDIGSSSSNHEYTFQTSDEKDAGDWIYQLLYAKKHWFYSRLLNKQYSHNNVKLTFGAPLAFVCERDNAPLPLIVEKILCEIEFRGLEEIGIYRKSASLSVVQQIKDEVNKMGDFNMENSLVFDIHNLTGCIKAYLRELPEPLISDELVKEISRVREVAQDEARFEIYKNVLPKLPSYNYNLIERLSRHMRMIEEYKSQNRMTSYNLATIMGGSLVEGCRPETMREAFGLMNFICEDWILHYERVFQ